VTPSNPTTQHACDDGSHGCDVELGICRPLLDNPTGYRCSCANTYRCSDGDCNSAGHTCVPTSDQSQDHSAGSGDDDGGDLELDTIMIVVIAAGIPKLLGLATALIWRVRKGHTLEGPLPIPQAVPPCSQQPRFRARVRGGKL